MPPPIAPRIEQLHRQFSNTIVSNDKPDDVSELKEVRPDSGTSSESSPSSPPTLLQRKRSIVFRNTRTDSRVDGDEHEDEDVLTSADEHEERCGSPADPSTPTTDIFALQAENALLTTQLHHERDERERLESELLTMRMAHERQLSNLATEMEDLRDELDALKQAGPPSNLFEPKKPLDGGYLVFDVNDRQKSRAMMAAASSSSFDVSNEQFDPATSLESKLQHAHEQVEARKPRRRFSFFSRRRADSHGAEKGEVKASEKIEGKTRRKSRRAARQAKKEAKRMSRQASKQSIDALDNGNLPLVSVEDDDDELPDHLPGESRSGSQVKLQEAKQIAELEAAAQAEEARVAKRAALAERRAKIKADRIANEEQTLEEALALIDDLEED
jgi:hypothetical protein